MIAITTFPHILVALNGLTLALLIAGRRFIKIGAARAHRRTMIGALCVSAVFLVLYLIYHTNSGLARFAGQGGIRPVYFSILFAHILGAAAIVPLVPISAWHALRGRRERHKTFVRITWPLWAFTAASGIVVYLFTVQLYPHAHV